MLEGLKEDWEVIEHVLPPNWPEKAKELRALFIPKEFKDAATLLRVMLIHLSDGCSLRETAARARVGEDEAGEVIKLLPLLRKLEIGQAGDWQAWLKDEQGRIAVRVCAIKKSATQTQKSQDKVRKEASKDGRKPKAQTLEMAGYCIVVSTLMEPSAKLLLELYRSRWQVELAFKRLKTLLQLGHLKKTDREGAKAWLQGKLLVASLTETLIAIGDHFSPWGYELQPQAT
jgi:Transposase DDE domain